MITSVTASPVSFGLVVPESLSEAARVAAGLILAKVIASLPVLITESGTRAHEIDADPRLTRGPGRADAKARAASEAFASLAALLDAPARDLERRMTDLRTAVGSSRMIAPSDLPGGEPTAFLAQDIAAKIQLLRQHLLALADDQLIVAVR